MPYCEQCGTEYKENASFCENCGAGLTSKKNAEYPVLDLENILSAIKAKAKIIFTGIAVILSFSFSMIMRLLQRRWLRRVFIVIASFLVIYAIVRIFRAELKEKVIEKNKKVSQKVSQIESVENEEFTDDFEAYDNREFLDGKPHWTSSDTYYDKGWMAVSGAPKKYARFWPSPWPGDFSFNSNYLTYHIPIRGQASRIIIDIDYSLQSRGDAKVFVSGDNSNWKEITDLLGFVKSDAPGERNTREDLSFLITEAGITTDLYIMFRAAAYSGDYWVFGLHRIAVKIESGS